MQTPPSVRNNNNTIKSFLEESATLSSRGSDTKKRTLKLLPRDEEDRVEVVLIETDGCQDDDMMSQSVTETDGCGDTQEGVDEVDGVDPEALTERSYSVSLARQIMQAKSLGTSMKVGEYFKTSVDEYM